MIKVTHASAEDGEVELIITASRFFADRLIPVSQQKKITLNINITDKPGRTPIAINWLLSKKGFFGIKPPQYFEMSVSIAAGVKDALETAANEIVHIAQVVSGRLKIQLKKRKVKGEDELTYAASWVGGKLAFVDMTPRSNRLWETEAKELKTQLVEEFLSWLDSGIKKLPTQKSSRTGYALYSIRPNVITASVSIPSRPSISSLDYEESGQILNLRAPILSKSGQGSGSNDVLSDERQTNIEQVPNGDTPMNMQAVDMPALALPAVEKKSLDQDKLVNHLGIDLEKFKIAVELPRLGMDRMLNSVMLHQKLNDLLERGLITHRGALRALRKAQESQPRQ